MKYKNVKTNNFVETDGIIRGEFWELVEEQKKEPTEKTKPAKRKPKTK